MLTDYKLQYPVNNGTNWTDISPSGSIAKSKFTGDNILVRLLDSDSKELDGETIPIISDGTNGIDGIDGENAIQLALAITPDTITLNADGNFKTGNTLTIKIQKTEGSVTTNIQKSSTATFKLWVGSNGYDISDYNSSTKSYSISLTGKNIQSDSYVHITYVDGDINLDKSVSVTQDGSQGLQGCVTRVSEWKAGVTYKHDSGLALGYIDVVGVRNSSAADGTGWDFYECKTEHTASTSDQPLNTSPYWTKLNNLGATYTSLLIADNAFIRFGATNQFVVVNSDNNQIEAGMKGSGDIRFWAGGGVTYDANNQPTDINLNNANFRVKKDGSLYAKNAYIEGEIHAKSGDFTGEITAESGKITGQIGVTGSLLIGNVSSRHIKIQPDTNGGAFIMHNGSKSLAELTFTTQSSGSLTVYLPRFYMRHPSLAAFSSIAYNGLSCWADSNLKSGAAYLTGNWTLSKNNVQVTCSIDPVTNQVSLGAYDYGNLKHAWPTSRNDVAYGDVYVENGYLKVKV